MSKIKIPLISFVYAGDESSPERLQRAYDRIFAIARKNLQKRAGSGKKRATLDDSKV
jgi:hypothetical protein